ncbi:putative aldouronate transport system substrate-binding protein [Friedmanniella endophytica]|uniref:Putative aldouronate transport system substrate-binding protein n=1 Tax=Microlunatus kandeliicorticis TaxID=1759536 RepID=A0A7W3P575_9ACTN|nr:extracellular solute-binding protein [Microlunatus kandeliicorticis]MBA8793681.1 putative aldouronate transport system substrate-binding protein [Microlunatus kandeliicorticis]
MSAFQVTRRRLLAGAGGAALLGATGLAGCSKSSSDEANSATVNDSVKLPTYVRYQGVKPDLPGTDAGVDPAFRYFPTDNPSVVPEKPGNGGSVSGMANIYYAVPPGPDRNSYWQGLNERLGTSLQLQMVSNADYTTKFATTIAGNDLPDMLQTPNGSPPPVANLPQLLDKRFTNLSEYLSGDAIKEYPNLANIPTASWKSTIFNGGIYGIPIPRGLIGSYNFIRADLFEAKGLPTSPKGYDELLSVAKELTDPKSRRWAFGLMSQLRQIFAGMNDEPTVWKYENGTLTHTYETEQFKQSVTDMMAFWKAGVVHPDAFNTALPFKQLFNAGTVAINGHDGYPGWTQYILDNASNSSFKLGLMEEYKRDGSGLAPWHLGSGIFSFTMLKKQDGANNGKDKITTLLRVLNWLAAPFGTSEYLYRLFGQKGVDHTVDAKNNPSLTATGTANTVLPIRYLADSPYTIYQPGRPGDADIQHGYQSKEIPTGRANPTTGLFSNTAATDNATADKNFNDGVNEIIQGRQPMSNLDGLISTWKSSVGDKMRNDYLPQLEGGAQPK